MITFIICIGILAFGFFLAVAPEVPKKNVGKPLPISPEYLAELAEYDKKNP